MTQEEKSLLLQDICARLPFGVILANGAKVRSIDVLTKIVSGIGTDKKIEDTKYYLHSMSSMTEEEKKELLNLLFDKEAKYFYIDEEGFIDGKTSDLMKEGLNYPAFCPINIVLYTDWLNSRHFDYRGLIERGLAIEAPEGMYEIQD